MASVEDPISSPAFCPGKLNERQFRDSTYLNIDDRPKNVDTENAVCLLIG